ncbi:MAG: hypothetical protein JAY99_02590 [Candidatus Thiodiazotropha lotti]|uniref:Outer membrane protein beta-barrel domain-containing protein n=1 Tax=Candidatus Thiodiazotropha endoloripes TaxID=1818881 RepID=A0A1E2ULS8_9GAMM|nr:hypothetical protein [Candidatus Thiodiazotropha endoloripes]MCG7898689.1 hypothetical protein [Candidatus Thiodiazotropha weberae]MCG7991889.1 hypothetical protein [Candidatus Thiodiazotropha lotti]MCG7901927.1 hypothetical protein [Candidatus Thiodiazotropha weberae]MCG7912981.1 hypothetical protein [Candidatus Thiodiazotropha weberae]MCG7998393.1 hypothetical protein [Candidatus Thiodiazotropha lotti]
MNRTQWLLTGLVLLPQSAVAYDTVVGARLGSLGFGIEAGYGLTEQFKARLGFNRYDFGFDAKVDGIEYDLDLQWRSLSLVADWHPFKAKSSFRFTAGVFRNNNEIHGSAGAENLTIGNTVYPGVGLDAVVGFRSYAPYLGVGWDTGAYKQQGWGFNVDLGVLYQGAGSVDLVPTGAFAELVDPNDIKLEEQRFEDDIEDYRYYPVFSFGFSYRF